MQAGLADTIKQMRKLKLEFREHYTREAMQRLACFWDCANRSLDGKR